MPERTDDRKPGKRRTAPCGLSLADVVAAGRWDLPARERDMKGTLIVLEGIDGSGKATQSKLLTENLEAMGKRVMQVSFPDYDSPSSSLVKMYLAGDFGKKPEDVNPYAASLFYAVDRFASFRSRWKEFYESGGIIVADRYTTSNMVHQMTKYEDPEEEEKFLCWLEDTEYGKLELPRPDRVILLDVPLPVTEKLVEKRSANGTPMDIHEKNWTYLCRCAGAYGKLADRYGWFRIDCMKDGILCGEEEIAAAVLAAAGIK